MAKVKEKVDGDGVVTQVPVVMQAEFGLPSVPVKVIKRVTIPLLSWPNDTTLVCQILDKIKEGKEIKGERGGKAVMGKAQLTNIMAPDYHTRKQLIVNTVLAAIFEEEYPKDAYIGKWFQMSKFAPNETKGKRYATFEVNEIAPPIRPVGVTE